MKTTLAMAAAGVWFSSATASDLMGQVSVIDGDTIEIHGQRIRLWGIDAPEWTQLCRGADSVHYRCGAVAANGLSTFIAGRPVVCAPKAVDRYGRTVALCTVAGTDLAGWMVGAGYALDWPRYSRGTYGLDQAKAEKAEAGIWSGSFAEPWSYRACVSAGVALPMCSDGN